MVEICTWFCLEFRFLLSDGLFWLCNLGSHHKYNFPTASTVFSVFLCLDFNIVMTRDRVGWRTGQWTKVPFTHSQPFILPPPVSQIHIWPLNMRFCHLWLSWKWWKGYVMEGWKPHYWLFAYGNSASLSSFPRNFKLILAQLVLPRCL